MVTQVCRKETNVYTGT